MSYELTPWLFLVLIPKVSHMYYILQSLNESYVRNTLFLKLSGYQET